MIRSQKFAAFPTLNRKLLRNPFKITHMVMEKLLEVEKSLRRPIVDPNPTPIQSPSLKRKHLLLILQILMA